VFCKPVVFGPNYRKFNEAVKLVADGGVFSYKKSQEFEKFMNQLFFNDEFYNSAAKVCETYIKEHKGATSKIISDLTNVLTI
jgi:3-deoxy-D-manno-octulosonic-acid transferase